MLVFLIKGLIIGFAIAAPVGPIGVLCIQRALHNGFKIGFMTGIGAALADGTYGLIAAFGLTAISSFLISQQFWVRLIGGLFLLYLGIKLLLSKQHKQTISNTHPSVWHACGTTYLLTLTNPATILSFVAIFAGLGLGTTHTNFMHAMALVISITVGSAIWWILLTGLIAFVLRHRLNKTALTIINWISGMIIIAFGILALVSIF